MARIRIHLHQLEFLFCHMCINVALVLIHINLDRDNRCLS